ncbi:MAG: metallophosphoesterase family protein, partial [Clostridia bacterium]|nr:metallophosphoesterase family protein [Clostridia bacterium]
MQQKRFISVLLAVVMMLTACVSSLTVFAFATENIEEVTLSQPMSTTAQTCVAMTVGSDENDRNFTWYFNSFESGYLDIAERNGDTFPSEYDSYKSTVAYSSVRSCYYHRVSVYRLKPDTRYVYRLRNGNVTSKNYYFQTDPVDAFNFIFVGDPQIGASGSLGNDGTNWGKTVNVMNQMFPETSLLVLAGDQVELCNDEDAYDHFLSPSLLPSFAMARSIGNHESWYKFSDKYAQNYGIHKEHFFDPNTLTNGKNLGSTDAGCDYWYSYNNVLFMHINSNNRSTAEHEEFMKAAVAANPNAAWRVVVMHYALFGAHYYDDSLVGDKRTAFTPIFDELDVDVVLNGHEHLYARSYMMENNSTTPKVVSSSVKSVTDPKGILYITASSSSGSKYYGFLDDSLLPHIAVKEKNLTTFTNIEVDIDSFKITTYNASNKSVVDTFEIVKTDPRIMPDNDSLAYGKDYTTTAPNRNDGWDDDGNKLTDGKSSNPDGSKTVYSGWNSESVEVVVDLENAQPTDTYTVYAVGGVWGIKLPKDVLSLEVYGSNNKTSGFQLIASSLVGSAELVSGTGKEDNTWSTYALTASVQQAVSYRYIKFVINHTVIETQEHIWIDEVAIDYTTAPKNILEGKEYELSGCGERAKYYANLSDGVAAAGPLDGDRHTK